MEPAILHGETVLISSTPYFFAKPKIGDIVAFKEKKSGKIFIKRVAKIDPSADEELYFVRGDNKRDSMDSRMLGWISKRDIIGRVIFNSK